MSSNPAMSTNALASKRLASAGRLDKYAPSVSNAHLHVDMNDCLAVVLDMGPIKFDGDMSQNAPLGVPYQGNPLT
jgi:hypothetical protein